MWTERVVIAEVPLAEHTRFIAVAPEDICHRDFVAAEERTSPDGMPDTRGVAVVSCHNTGTRWGTGGPRRVDFGVGRSARRGHPDSVY